MSCITDLGCSLVTKFYKVCKIFAVFSFTIIVIVSTTAWTVILRLLDVRSMSEEGMGNACCKSRLQQGNETTKECLQQNELDQTTLVNDLIAKNTRLDEEKGRLEEKVEVLERELEEERNDWTERFGKDIERRAKGNFNNTGDPVQPIDISKRNEDMFDEEWRDVMVTLFKEDEEYGIYFLSKILQDCQTFCKATADEQIAIFTNPCSPGNRCDVTEILVSEEDVHNLYKLRRRIGQHKSTKDAVIEYVYNEVKKDEAVQNLLTKFKSRHTENGELKSEHETAESGDAEDDHESGENEDRESESSTGMSELLGCLEVYIKKCTDMCWEAAISDPPLCFKFDVVGYHIDQIKSQFYEYSSKISTGVGEHDTVKTVVWPALVTTCSGGREVLIAHKKGCVLLYDNKNT